ncbi:MAG: M20/M25/M40 family metallo-hydrolase [Armatimonadetes bacterium]|nr:M20/M25/M40 family metallo-hydrolase [Armatimonadota bacterium]MDW8027572.1 M20/M25/M40 family metallo-hydrolase [Armatimonadota bacterium]
MRRCLLALLSLPLILAAQNQPLINHKRMTNLFLQLVHIDSGNENEAEICQFVAERLKELNPEELFIDDASKKIGGTGGNVFARFKGTVNGKPVMLSAHLDTVAPTKGIKVILTETEIKTDRTTILGADDKAGVALIFEAIRTLRERNLPHPPIEVVFTIREEKGLLGAKVFDKSKLKARYGIIVDGSGEPSDLIIGSPTHFRFEAIFYGKAAHAGVEPEKGINAIAMASDAIAAMNWGRIDEDTTANVGTIEGGQAMNIVPDRCKVIGEFRSHDPQKVEGLVAKWKQVCEQVALKFGSKVDLKVEKTFDAIRLSPEEPIVKAAMKAIESLGLKPKLKRMGGGTDGNVFAAHGIQCLVLPTGGENYHSTDEKLVLANFYAVGEILVRTIVELAKH